MFLISLHGKESINEQIQKQIIHFISLGVLKANEKLPSVRELASELGINPNTVMKAYQNLEDEGYIYMLSKKGAFVNDRPVSADNELLEEIEKMIKRAKDAGVDYMEIDKVLKEVYNA